MKILGKVNGKVVYDEDNLDENVYTMRLDTGDYVTIRVSNTRADKVALDIGDSVALTIEKVAN
ncbi:hypothetical protein [Megasphaera sp.]|uniref:hypothetical protein n=1 Tax=Megasphaera sp. TaxID=2023260 RepID=UPI00351FD1EA